MLISVNLEHKTNPYKCRQLIICVPDDTDDVMQEIESQIKLSENLNEYRAGIWYEICDDDYDYDDYDYDEEESEE